MVESVGTAAIWMKWNELFLENRLSSNDIRTFWTENAPKLVDSDHCASCRELSAYKDAVCEATLIQPLSLFLHGGDHTDDQPETGGCPSLVCGRVFNNGDPTYHCRDCELDPTCVLCTDCFKQSAHRHHRYGMSISLGMGGYCDCGDAEAWKSDPCCTAHQPPPSVASAHDDVDSPPVEQEPPPLLHKAEIVFAAAVGYVLDALGCLRSFPEDVVGSALEPTALIHPALAPPPDRQRYMLVLYYHGQDNNDKVADAIRLVTACSSEDARATVAVLRQEGVAPIFCGDFNVCSEVLARLGPVASAAAGDLGSQRPRQLRQLDRRVMHRHVVAHQRLALRLVRYLRRLLETSSALRPVFSKVMLQSGRCSEGEAAAAAVAAVDGGEASAPLERLMAIDGHMWKLVRHECHLLYIHGLLMDATSRLAFAQMFVEWYPQQLMSSRDSAFISEFGGVQDLSVQMFTVPSVAHHLIGQHNALTVVLSVLVQECALHARGDKQVLDTRLLNGSAQLLLQFERLLGCFTDARYLLNSVPSSWTEQLLQGFRSGLDSYIQLLYHMEDMEPVTRVHSEHVLYEAPYELQVTLAVALAPLSALMVRWCASNRQLLIHAYRCVLTRLRSRMPPDKFSVEPVQLFGRQLTVSRHSVLYTPVSLNLPLSRFLVSLNLQLAKHDLSWRSSELSMDPPVGPLELMERPLRAIVVDAQVFSNQWRRNGRSLEIICSWYSLTLHGSELRDRDIQMLQICSAVLDPDQFVASLLFRHSANAYVSFMHLGGMFPVEGDLREHVESNVSDFLLTLIHVVTERYHPDIAQVSAKQCLRKEVLQWLCLKPMSHSQLCKRLPEDAEGLLEEVLGELAVLSSSDASRGLPTYSIKPEFYGEYNCMWWRYSRRHRAMSEERMRQLRQQPAAGSCSTQPQLPGAVPPPAGLPPFKPALRAIGRLLHCRLTVSILATLINSVGDQDSGPVCELILHRALHLIGVALIEEQEGSQSPSGRVDAGASSFSQLANSSGLVSGLRTLLACADRAGVHSDLIGWLLGRLNRLSSSASSSSPTAASSSSLSTTAAAGSSIDADGERLRRGLAADARRQRILQHMQAQQRRFLAKHESAASPSASASQDSSDTASAGAEAAGVATSAGRQFEDMVCILCQAGGDGRGEETLVLCAFVQASSVAAVGAPGSCSSRFRQLLPHATSCGHVMHPACWQRHVDTAARDRRRAPRVHHMSGFDVHRGEYLCPLCQRLSNTVLPLLPPATGCGSSGSCQSIRPSAEQFLSWWDGVFRGVVVTDEDMLAGEAVSMETTSTDPSSSSSASCTRPRESSEGVPKQSKTTLKMVKKFCTACHQARGDAASSGSVSPVISLQTAVSTLHCCAYTVQATVHLLDYTQRPLLASLDSRTDASLSALVRLAALLPTVLPSIDGGAVCALDLLQWAVVDTVASDGETMVQRLDPFMMAVVMRCSRRQVSGVSRYLEDLNGVRLCLLLCLTQAVLSYNPAASTSAAMETDTAPVAMDTPCADSDDDFTPWLVQFYQLVIEHHVTSPSAELTTAPNPEQLTQHVYSSVLSFLRCCVLFDRYLADYENVCGSPEQLQLLLTPEEQCRQLLDRLSLTLLPPVSPASALHVVNTLCSQLDTVGSPLDVIAATPQMSSIVSLPEEYSDLILQASSLGACECGGAGVDSVSPTLCLLCGRWLCSDLLCTRDGVSGRRGIDAHAIFCGHGVAIFLIVRRCKLYLVDACPTGFRRALYPPPYVDRFGEVDEGLRRGTPLKLWRRQYANLVRLWMSHGVPDQVSRYVEEMSAGHLMLE